MRLICFSNPNYSMTCDVSSQKMGGFDPCPSPQTATSLMTSPRPTFTTVCAPLIPTVFKNLCISSEDFRAESVDSIFEGSHFLEKYLQILNANLATTNDLQSVEGMGFSEEEKNLAEILFGHSVDAHSALQNIQFYIHARQQLRARGQEVGPAPESLSLLFEVWNQKPEMVAQVVKRFLNTYGQSTSFVMPGREFPYGYAQLLNFVISMPAHPAIRAVADDIAHELTQWVEDCRQKAVAAYAQNDTSPYYRYNDVAVSTFLRSGHRGSLWPLFFLTRYYRATGQQDALEKLKPIVGDVVGLMHLKKCRLDETHLAKLPIQWGALNGQDYIQPNFFGEGTKGFLPWVYGDMGPGSQTAMMLLLAYEHFGVDEIVVEKMTLKNILENMINNADLSVPQMPEMRDQESQKYGSQLLEFPHGWNVTRMMLFGVVAGLDGLDESVRAASKEAAQALLLMKLK